MKRKYSICFALLLSIMTGCAKADAQTAETISHAGSFGTTIAESSITTTAIATTVTTTVSTSAAQPETTSLTSVPETTIPETVPVVATEPIPSETEPAYDTFTGILIDEDCSDVEDPELHDLPCMLMDSCSASGYGLDIQTEDGAWQFIPFDEKGQELAWDYLLQTSQPDHLYVTITGTNIAGVIHVAQLAGRS
jgi:hypothetical protein